MVFNTSSKFVQSATFLKKSIRLYFCFSTQVVHPTSTHSHQQMSTCHHNQTDGFCQDCDLWRWTISHGDSLEPSVGRFWLSIMASILCDKWPIESSLGGLSCSSFTPKMVHSGRPSSRRRTISPMFCTNDRPLKLRPVSFLHNLVVCKS